MRPFLLPALLAIACSGGGNNSTTDTTPADDADTDADTTPVVETGADTHTGGGTDTDSAWPTGDTSTVGSTSSPCDAALPVQRIDGCPVSIACGVYGNSWSANDVTYNGPSPWSGTFEIWQGETLLTSVPTDADGCFEAPLAEGTYDVCFWDGNYYYSDRAKCVRDVHVGAKALVHCEIGFYGYANITCGY